MARSILRRTAVALALLFATAALWAHPHMFFESEAEFVWKGDRLAGVYLTWTFDHAFSAVILQYDANGDGAFSPAETKAVYDNAFVYLKNYYYFTFIRQGAKRSNPDRVSEFSVSQKAGKASYRFYIDLSGYATGPLYLAVYDYTFYCSVSYPKGREVRLRRDAAIVDASWRVVENRDFPVYYNPRGAADDTTVYYQWRKGLETFYPLEIEVRSDRR
ncbi:MAG TPA: DUF1007 family protein [Treponemataceae bacterium]|jgi:ABC-type uncharacterized transport system substrate-binding protein|nr:DUF1007 family protein [Treponemataceae bacterium]